MGVPLDIYRINIGRFGPGRGCSGERPSKQKYNAQSWCKDIHLRVLVTALLLTGILAVCERTLAYGLLNYELSSFVGPDVCGNSSNDINLLLAVSPTEIGSDIRNFICPDRQMVSFADLDISFHSNIHIHERLLLLAADVETNPGRTNEDTEILLAAIAASETKLLEEIRSVKDDIAIIKSEIATVKADSIKTKREIENLKTDQSKTNDKVKTATTNVNTLYSLQDQMQLDIDQLNDDFQTKVDLIEKMEEDIDILDARSRTHTMRIFELEEIEHDSYTELRNNIVDNVLK